MAITARTLRGAFVMAVVAVLVAIIVAAPQEAGPGASGSVSPSLAAGLSPGIAAGATAATDPDSDPADTVDDGAGSGGGAGGPPVATVSRPAERLKGYRWPLTEGRITRLQGEDREGLVVVDGQRFQPGIDVAARCGTRVRAAHAGLVLATDRDVLRWAGFDDGSIDPLYARAEQRGETELLPAGVVINDGNLYWSIYTGLDEVTVERGDEVRAGDPIGTIGRPAEGGDCALRYELMRADGPYMRVAPVLVRRQRYPEWTRERVDPLRVLSLDDRKAPELAPGVTPPPDLAGASNRASEDGTTGVEAAGG